MRRSLAKALLRLRIWMRKTCLMLLDVRKMSAEAGAAFGNLRLDDFDGLPLADHYISNASAAPETRPLLLFAPKRCFFSWKKHSLKIGFFSWDEGSATKSAGKVFAKLSISLRSSEMLQVLSLSYKNDHGVFTKWKKGTDLELWLFSFVLLLCFAILCEIAIDVTYRFKPYMDDRLAYHRHAINCNQIVRLARFLFGKSR